MALFVDLKSSDRPMFSPRSAANNGNAASPVDVSMSVHSQSGFGIIRSIKSMFLSSPGKEPELARSMGSYTPLSPTKRHIAHNLDSPIASSPRKNHTKRIFRPKYESAAPEVHASSSTVLPLHQTEDSYKENKPVSSTLFSPIYKTDETDAHIPHGPAGRNAAQTSGHSVGSHVHGSYSHHLGYGSSHTHIQVVHSSVDKLSSHVRDIECSSRYTYETEEVDHQVEAMYEDHPYSFLKNVLPLLKHHRAGPPPVCLPKRSSRSPPISLVLDLDETLVHCSLEPLATADLTFNVLFNNTDFQVHVCKRPHLEHFLSTVAEWFEVIVFTASQKAYAEKLLNILDPDHKWIKHRVYRESCVVIDGNYLKDLTVLNRDLNQVFIVDNSPQAFAFQIDNGIPIESWYEDKTDRELIKLLPFLKVLSSTADVRPHIRNRFKVLETISR
eukprot:GILJ01003412.1.p1 GENE.GILJ01003412.1~~GILJ01003412.1.p1  ORF type:complete len:442 (-),score=64.39 GILJ01003412.1:281-1606(-)